MICIAPVGDTDGTADVGERARKGVVGGRVADIAGVAEPPGEDIRHDARAVCGSAAYRSNPGCIGGARHCLVEANVVQRRGPRGYAIEDYVAGDVGTGAMVV